MKRSQAETALKNAAADLQLLEMKRAQILTAIERAETDSALLKMKQEQTLAAIEQVETDIKLLEMKRAQTLTAIERNADDLQLLEQKRSQILTAIERTETDIALLKMKQAQTLAALEQVETDSKLLEMKRAQTLTAIERNTEDIRLLEMKRAQALAKFDEAADDRSLLQYNLAEAERDLADTRLYAAVSGIVSTVKSDVGDSVTAQTSVIRIVNIDRLKAVVEIDEIDMAEIALGQTIELEFDAVSDQTVAAYVSYIPVEGRYTSQGIGVVDVEITIDNPPKKLKPSYTFAGGIQVSEGGDVLAVNQDALVELPVGGTYMLLIKQEDGTTLPTRVTTDYLSDGMVRIITGEVEAGDIAVKPETAEDGTAAAPNMMLPGVRVPGTGGGPGGGTGGGASK
jgi:multidrug resistance efflux pump